MKIIDENSKDKRTERIKSLSDLNLLEVFSYTMIGMREAVFCRSTYKKDFTAAKNEILRRLKLASHSCLRKGGHQKRIK